MCVEEGIKEGMNSASYDNIQVENLCDGSTKSPENSETLK